MTYEGLVLDLDGTLVRGEPGTVHPEDIAAIRSLIRRQVPVVLATGRTRFGAANLMDQIGIIEPAIVLYGAQIFCPRTGKDEELIPMDIRDVERLTEWALENHLSPHLITPQGTVVLGHGDKLAHLAPFLPYDNVTEGYTPILEVVLPTSDTALRQRFLQLFDEEAFNCLAYVRERAIICLNAETDKGLALRRLMARRGWDPSRFIAIGNDPTDLPMFEEVGLGLAVGSKHPELCARAHKVMPQDCPNLIAVCIKEYFKLRDQD